MKAGSVFKLIFRINSDPFSEKALFRFLTVHDRSFAYQGMSVRIGEKADTQRYPLFTVLSCNFLQ